MEEWEIVQVLSCQSQLDFNLLSSFISFHLPSVAWLCTCYLVLPIVTITMAEEVSSLTRNLISFTVRMLFPSNLVSWQFLSSSSPRNLGNTYKSVRFSRWSKNSHSIFVKLFPEIFLKLKYKKKKTSRSLTEIKHLLRRMTKNDIDSFSISSFVNELSCFLW